MEVAIVHDYLTQRGGAERVVLAMAKAFPLAPIYTSLFDPEGTFPAFASMDVRPLEMNRIPGLRHRHRLALPVLAPAFSRLQIDADVTLCSSSGWAHGAQVTGRKIVYCYTPARWLYQRDRYARPRSLKALAATVIGEPLRSWDARQARSADRYLAISSAVQDRIRLTYGIDAELLPPPHGTDSAGPLRAIPGIDPGFHLCVSRLLPYKNVAAIVAAFSNLFTDQLVIVGTGPEEGRLRQIAPPNVHLVGTVADDQLRWLYSSCRTLVAASYEDFGLTPVEAATFGRPSVVLRWGGFLDTVVEGQTGIFFDRPEAAVIAEAVVRARGRRWDSDSIARHAETYSEDRFIERLRRVVHSTAAAIDGETPSNQPRSQHPGPFSDGVTQR